MSQDTMDAERDGRVLERKRIVRYIRREAVDILEGMKAGRQSLKISQCLLILAKKVEKLKVPKS